MALREEEGGKEDADEVLWTPSERSKASSAMWHLLERCLAGGKDGEDKPLQALGYDDLHAWSVQHPEEFWRAVVEDLDPICEGDRTTVFGDGPEDKTSQKPALVRRIWFPDMRLSVAENLLQIRDSDETAIVAHREDASLVRSLSRRQLYDQVRRVFLFLRDELRIGRGDVVVAFMPNVPETIVVMLAANALGATWSSCSPDFGFTAVLDRFGQIEPKVLLAADGYTYKGKAIPVLDLVHRIVEQLPTLQRTILVPFLHSKDLPPTDGTKFTRYADVLRFPSDTSVEEPNDGAIAFDRVPSTQPLYIMFSSGTTDKPKCLVQGWGVVLNQWKEHRFHMAIDASSVLFFYTTCGWMMWNWTLAALSTAKTLVLYDGAAVTREDPALLFRLAAAERVTHFGTSAAYLTALEEMRADLREVFGSGAKRLAKRSIGTVLVTGSVSSAANFRFVRDQLGSEVQYISMSGGTEINGCFALGCPLKPVRIGQLQCLALGADVQVLDDDAQPITERPGELVCRNAIPCMPLFFWNDQDTYERYTRAYFAKYGPTIWCHGDFAEITREGGLIIHGRSDATMNPGGVRIGSSDIYNALEDVDEVTDCVAVGQAWNGDERVLLFVVVRPNLSSGEERTRSGEAEGKTRDVLIDPQLAQRLRQQIRSRLSPRHVPAKIIGVEEIPYTFNHKKSEISVKRLVDGKHIPNMAALRNPQAVQKIEALRSAWQT